MKCLGFVLLFLLTACGNENEQAQPRTKTFVNYYVRGISVNGVTANPELYQVLIDYSKKSSPELEIIRLASIGGAIEYSFGKIPLASKTPPPNTDVAYAGKNDKLEVDVSGMKNRDENWMSRFALSATGEAGIVLNAIEPNDDI